MSKDSNNILKYYKYISIYAKKCKFCKKYVAHYDDNLSSLEEHMMAKHPHAYSFQGGRDEDTTDDARCITSELDINCNVVPRMSTAAEKEINDRLVKMITHDLQPLSIVENKGFIDLVQALNPNYKLPSSNAIASSLLKQDYDKTRAAVSSLLESAEYVSLSMDAWTSTGHESFVSLTCHFINSEWEHKSVFLSCFTIPADHTAENLRDDILSELVEWKINEKVVCVVCDNASNFIEALELTGIPQVGCLADTLHLVVTEALNVPKLQDILKKCTTIVEYLNRSTDASNKLKETQSRMQKPLLNMINSTPTRWNTTLEMLERLVEIQEPLEATLELLNNPSIDNLSSCEWETLSELILILQPFNEIAIELSLESYTPLSKILIMIRGLESCLIRRMERTETNQICVDILHELMRSIKSRFTHFEYTEMYAMSSFLDPRFKGLAFADTSAFQYCREEMELLLEISSEQLDEADVSADKSLEKPLIWQEFDRAINSSKSVVEKYINDNLLYRKECPLLWWNDNNETYPGLALLAKKYLSVVATTSSASEGKTFCDRRSSLDSKTIDTILFLHYNHNVVLK